MSQVGNLCAEIPILRIALPVCRGQPSKRSFRSGHLRAIYLPNGIRHRVLAEIFRDANEVSKRMPMFCCVCVLDRIC
jgi:hypothetical protein